MIQSFMARPLRIEFPHAFYHITSRGNAGDDIIRNDEDRFLFLELLGQTVDQFQWICHAYCLMDNHYHLLIETPLANLSRGMRFLNGVYTQKFDRRHNRKGHIFQGRFKAVIVDRDNYLIELSRYLALNPVRAHMVEDPGDWKWSSYRATIDKAPVPSFLTIDYILSFFGKTGNHARRSFASFVHKGITEESPWKNLQGQIFLGDKDFIAECKDHLSCQESRETPRPQRYAQRPSLKKLFRNIKTKSDRNKQIKRAFREYGYTLQEIADESGLHYSSVSRIARTGNEIVKYKT